MDEPRNPDVEQDETEDEIRDLPITDEGSDEVVGGRRTSDGDPEEPLIP